MVKHGIVVHHRTENENAQRRCAIKSARRHLRWSRELMVTRLPVYLYWRSPETPSNYFSSILAGWQVCRNGHCRTCLQQSESWSSESTILVQPNRSDCWTILNKGKEIQVFLSGGMLVDLAKGGWAGGRDFFTRIEKSKISNSCFFGRD